LNTKTKHTSLELHFVGEFSLGQSESSSKILFQDSSLTMGLDGGQNLCVNSSLISLPLLRWFVRLLLRLENVSLLLGLVSLNPDDVRGFVTSLL